MRATWRIEHPTTMVLLLATAVALLSLQLELNTRVLDMNIVALRAYKDALIWCQDK